MSSPTPEVAAAYREAKARGLPDGWTCTIDKRNRRKWTAPDNGRSCDSIPKALQISVEMGLLPPDTSIAVGKRKHSIGAKNPRSRKQAKRRPSVTVDLTKPEGDDLPNTSSEEVEGTEEEEEENQREPPQFPLDPEHSLDGTRAVILPQTVHWDPDSPDGQKIGWKVRIEYGVSKWANGRIVRYDPHSHKHKLTLTDENDKRECGVWIWIRNDQHNIHISTRLVWAHVKGYAWWPALVTESNAEDDRKNGYVQVEFFASGDASTLRDSPECIRPFSPYTLDPVVVKHRKKRNAKAFQLACEEFHRIRKARNEAALFYAERAFRFAQNKGAGLVGKRIQVYRNDVNYPAGDLVRGKVRKYSVVQKKWLVSFEISKQTHKKYEPAWINLKGRGSHLKVLDEKKVIVDNEALIPFLVGYIGHEKRDDQDENERLIMNLLHDRCRGCVECFRKEEVPIRCEKCNAPYHLGCLDPPLLLEQYQRYLKDGSVFICPTCKQCRGCYQRDVAFGSHPLEKIPTNLSFPPGESLDVCSTCRECYSQTQYCPNCAHTWDDSRYYEVRKQLEWSGNSEGRKRKTATAGLDSLIEDSNFPVKFGSYTGDNSLPTGARVHPSCYHVETTQWGYTEVEMLVCDGCHVWVHAGCAGISEEEYDATSERSHPIYSKEFLCRQCCRARCKKLIEAMQQEDTSLLFAEPVNERVAPNYRDVIKTPIDLKTMMKKAEGDDYLNYAWVRDDFELMVYNALTFNRFYTIVWNEAKKYYERVVKAVFGQLGKAAPAGEFSKRIAANFAKAEEERKKEEDRVQIDESVEKKDLVAGSLAASVILPKLRDAPPDQRSCLPFKEVELTPVDAFYCCWMDSCYTCGCTGAADTMLFCVDCGEAFHSFCVGAPVHSMDAASVAGWRCPNCKICEISGEVPRDETRMLFCEMCDRAFSLDLLEPPLSTAPPGLWICGQCVDCRYCGNSTEPLGRSLMHWSRYPDRCYRCNGCSGVADDYMSKMRCNICAGYLRRDDVDFVECTSCGCNVHIGCDHEATDFVARSEAYTRNRNAEKMKYRCPSCRKEDGQSPLKVDFEKQIIDQIAFWGVNEGGLFPIASQGLKQELHSRLADAIDWEARERCRNEYIAIIRDGLRLMSESRDLLGAARYVIQRARDSNPPLPDCTVARAARFVTFVKRMKLADRGCKIKRIETCVIAAKLASSFICVACSIMGKNLVDCVSIPARVVEFLSPPNTEGIFELPRDKIRCSALDNTEYKSHLESLPDIEPTRSKSKRKSVDKTQQIEPSSYILAKPLCGWIGRASSTGGQGEWKDPRECCLCHICGDDDAGIPVEQSQVAAGNELKISPLGRLLPMTDGLWVHTSCALWSSEVWEAADDGLINDVEKARSRGAQLKCFGCGRAGATVGCCKSNCPFNYHFPCARVCGAVFTSNQRVYCSIHKASATSTLVHESVEYMKALMINQEKKDSTGIGTFDLCIRVGAITVHSLGRIETDVDGFHSENYITPPGYVATRIFWSALKPRTRALYVLSVLKTNNGRIEFVILPGDEPSAIIKGQDVTDVYNKLLERVRKVNLMFFSHGNLRSTLPAMRRTRKKTFGLNGHQFFGFGLDHIRKRLEASPGVEAVVAPLSSNSPMYSFCFMHPEVEAVLALQRKRAAANAERELENSSGCARTEGIKAVARCGGSGRITRVLVRSAEEVGDILNTSAKKGGDEKATTDRNIYQLKYRRMKNIPIDQRLVARRSHIHGWGLFTKLDIAKDEPIVEYMGEIIRQPISDQRERAYEVSGEGSCYMFRLDLHRIVDATKIGCMARFMNHSCDPNAYAKIILVDTEQGQDKKIVVFAKRSIVAGEEVTYDYKFPVEDGSLRCLCGAPNCIGRLN